MHTYRRLVPLVLLAACSKPSVPAGGASLADSTAVATTVESAVDAPPAGTDGLLQAARSTSGTSRRYVYMRILRT